MSVVTEIAKVIGWFAIALFVACTPLIVLGWRDRRAFKREAKHMDDESLPLLPSQFMPYVPPSWRRFEDEDLRDPTPHDPAP